MSIAPPRIPTDWYHLDALVAATSLKKWFEGPESAQNKFAPDQFFQVLEIMKYETPFQGGPIDSRDTIDHLAQGDGLAKRRAVWKIIAEAIHTPNTSLDSRLEKANWLQEQIRLCRQYADYLRELESFHIDMRELNLSIQLHPAKGAADADVVVSGSFNKKGELAYENVKGILERIIPALEKHIAEL